MLFSGKQFRLAVLISIILLVAGIIFVLNFKDNKTSNQIIDTEPVLQITGTKEQNKQNVIQSIKPRQKKLETNEDIKNEYGRLEVVYLFDNTKYEGAVISTDEFYTMVTTGGIVKFPMNQVKLRNIIK